MTYGYLPTNIDVGFASIFLGFDNAEEFNVFIKSIGNASFSNFDLGLQTFEDNNRTLLMSKNNLPILKKTPLKIKKCNKWSDFTVFYP